MSITDEAQRNRDTTIIARVCGELNCTNLDPQQYVAIVREMQSRLKSRGHEIPNVDPEDTEVKFTVADGGEVYSRKECVFNYCPDPAACRAADACQNPVTVVDKAS